MAARICKDCDKGLPPTAEYWPTKYGQISGLVCRKCNSKRVAIYQKQRKLDDPEYKAARNKSSVISAKKRYNSDPAFKQYMHNAAKKYMKALRLRSAIQRAKDSAAGCKWAYNNKAKCAAKSMARHALKLGRTPRWLTEDDKQSIAKLYVLARELSYRTGVEYQVDHILPLQGRHVSGLHVPSNLQVITATLNKSKGNKYAV